MPRKIEFVLTILLIVFTLPLLGIVLLITWLELRCNVIFSESRVGKNGKLFKMHKVTTMKPTKENLAARALGPIRKNDPRITLSSRLIRRYSLDELPQLFNVIKGEMSLIGPRPELPKSVEHWDQKLPLYRERLTVLPGISGWAQVNGYRKGYIEPEKRLNHDLIYIRHQTPWFYLKIFTMTPWAIIKYEVW